MNQKEYTEKIKELETEQQPINRKPVFQEATIKETSENPYIPTKGNKEENIEKHRKFLEDYGDEIEKHKQEQKNKEINKKPKSTQELLQEKEDVNDLPDITEFLETEEYIRMGTDYKIPIPITMPNGQTYKIYIRSLNSNEYYQYQLRQVREKKSMNYLVAVDICEDSHGNKLPKKFFDKLGFDYVEQIGEAISLASGTNGSDSRIQQVVENFLQ